MRGRLGIAACLIAACAATNASTPTPGTAPAGTPRGFEGSQTPGFDPAGPGAKSYAPTAAADGRAQLPSDDLRRALLAEVRAAARKLGRPAPAPDARLDWAMTDLAGHLGSDDVPALDVVDFLLAHYGLVEPSPHILLSGASPRAAGQIAAGARAEIAQMIGGADIARVGVGVARSADKVKIVLALQEKHVSLLSAIPRRLLSGGHAGVAARIAGGFTKPEIVITAPGGAVGEQTPPLLKGVVRGELRCAADGRYQVEIVATGPTGSAVLANFPVFCGVAPPTTTPRGGGVRPVAIRADEAEQRLLALINADRKRAGVAPVVTDERLTAIARAHTHDMVDHDFVGHVSPRTGNTVERVHRAGLTPGFISENVGRGYTVDEAEEGFMSSPGHRANIVDPRPRKVGVGIVFGAPVTGTRPLFVTQLFTD